MKTGQCFIYNFTVENRKGYFFTGLIDNGLLVMCEMVRRVEDITPASYWKMSQEYFDEAVKSGRIELI
jgi:hypothetical protein